MAGLPSTAVFFVLLQFVVDASASDYSHSLYGKTYRISDIMKQVRPFEARAQCISEQGTLVDIQSEEEMAYLIDVLGNLIGAHLAYGRTWHYLVGGIYKESVSDPGKGKGKWYYESGNVMTYTNWQPNFPVDEANRPCNTIFYSHDRADGRMYNVVNNSNWISPYICAREASGAFKYGYYGNSYYVASGGSNGFTGMAAAREKCRDHEGVLADIHSAEELRHVRRLLHSLYPITQPVSTWWFAIGGKKINSRWIYEDGTKMEYTNWIPGEEGKDGCAILDPVTTPSEKYYLVEPCDKVHINYTICSKKVVGTSMRIIGDNVEGAWVRWTCVSYPAGNYSLEFRVISGDLSHRRTAKWRTVPPHGIHYITKYSASTTSPYTGVTQNILILSITTDRTESGLLASCGKHRVPDTGLDAYKFMVAYPASGAVISDTKNMIEGKRHVITVTVGESFPQSQVEVKFQSKHNTSIRHRQKSNTEPYPGFIAVSTITFVPDRSDNGTSVIVRVTNQRFPEQNLVKSEIVHVLFEPKGDTKSMTSSETQVGIQTQHIIGFLVGLLGLLCAALALVVYIRVRGVKMCPSSGTLPRQVFVDEMSTIEARNQQRGGTVHDGIAPIPYDTREPVVCEYDDTSELPQYEPIVVGVDDTPISAAVCGNIPPPETFAPDNTSAQLVLNEPYDVVQDHSSQYKTTNPNTYDIVVDETPLP